MTSLDVDVYCRTVVQPVESWRADLEFRGTRRAGGGGGHGRSRWLRTSRQGPAQTPSPPASLTVLSLPCHCPFTDSQNRFCCRSYEVLETYVQSAVDREALVATAAAAYEAEGPLAWLRMYFDEVVWPVAEAQTRSAGCRCRCCCCPPPRRGDRSSLLLPPLLNCHSRRRARQAGGSAGRSLAREGPSSGRQPPGRKG